MPTNRQLYRRFMRSSRSARRRGRTRARSPRTFSIPQLLERQPKTLRRHPLYPQILEYLRTDRQLRAVALSRNAYTKLQTALVSPSDIQEFYQRYALAPHPFYPLFLTAKREYLAERERIQNERRDYIRTHTRNLPAAVVTAIRYLGHLETHYNRRNEHPVWSAQLYPKSKKRVHQYERYATLDWIRTVREHLQALGTRYPALTSVIAERVLACFVLECLPAAVPPPRPGSRAVKERYRALCLHHHPDQGGDAQVFIELKVARDTLLR